MTSALIALALMPSAASASGTAAVSITNVVNQGGLYSAASPAAGFFDVRATNTGGSHLTHEDLRVYVPLSFTPLAAFTMSAGTQTLQQGCSIQTRTNASQPAFLCSWDENWDVGDGKGPITFAVGGSTAGTWAISATLSPAAQPPIGTDDDFLTVTTVGSGDRATYYTGPKTGTSTVETNLGSSSQSAKIELPSTTNGYVVDLAETSGSFSCGGTTPSGQIGQLITSHINQGASVAPFIKWTVVIVVPGAPSYDTTNLAIYHCTNDLHLDVITQTDVCPPTPTDGCMISLSSKFLVTRGVATTTVTVVFETLTNGFVKGGAG